MQTAGLDERLQLSYALNRQSTASFPGFATNKTSPLNHNNERELFSKNHNVKKHHHGREKSFNSKAVNIY